MSSGALPGEERIARWREIEDAPLAEIHDSLYYRHVQSSPSSDWLIVHNLGKKPSATCIATDGGTFSGTATHLSDSVLSLHFSRPVMGEAYLT